MRRLHLEHAVDLLHQKKAVRQDLDGFRPELRSARQREQECAVFGDVVGRLAERREQLFRRPPVQGFDVNTRARRSRVPAGRAVNGGAKPHGSEIDTLELGNDGDGSRTVTWSPSSGPISDFRFPFAGSYGLWAS